MDHTTESPAAPASTRIGYKLRTSHKAGPGHSRGFFLADTTHTRLNEALGALRLKGYRNRSHVVEAAILRFLDQEGG